MTTTTVTAINIPTLTNTTMTLRTRRTFIGALALAALHLSPFTWAQDFPTKPIKVIVPYSAGGGADILARVVGQELSQRLKQPVIVENQGGGSNTIGMRTVATSPKDGYTLGLA